MCSGAEEVLWVANRRTPSLSPASEAPARPPAWPRWIYTEITVSRAIAVALLLVFACDVVSPVLFGNEEPALPACCRRDGKHHCMRQTPSTVEVVPLKAVPERCPYFPKNPTAAGGQIQFPPPSPSVIAFVFSHPTAKVQTEARYRVSLIRGWQKRGPPSLA